MAVLKIKDADGNWVKVGIGAQGSPGSNGVSIVSIERTSGNGSAGSTDAYTITMSDGSTSTFSVYNGADGTMTFEDLTEEQKATLKGDKGDTGADGVSCTHEWNGTTLAVTSASGTSSADLKGEKGDKGDAGAQGEKGETGATGANGYTPVKGTDYWTEADKAEMVNDVLAALPAAEGVSV